MSKAMQLMTLTTGSFENLVDSIAVENFQDQADMPEQLVQFVAKLKATLHERRDGFETAVGEIYAKHFTDEEIDGLISFYGSDLGKKYNAAAPIFGQELVLAVGDWRNKSLESNRSELHNILGVNEPEPASPPEAAVAP